MKIIYKDKNKSQGCARPSVWQFLVGNDFVGLGWMRLRVGLELERVAVLWWCRGSWATVAPCKKERNRKGGGLRETKWRWWKKERAKEMLNVEASFERDKNEQKEEMRSVEEIERERGKGQWINKKWVHCSQMDKKCILHFVYITECIGFLNLVGHFSSKEKMAKPLQELPTTFLNTLCFPNFWKNPQTFIHNFPIHFLN